MRFYSDVFGWFVEKWQGPEDYWNCSTGEEDEPGINGAIMRRPADAAAAGRSSRSASTTSTTRSTASSGRAAQVVQGRRTIPYVGYHAYCRDPEGNVFGLMRERRGRAALAGR